MKFYETFLSILCKAPLPPLQNSTETCSTKNVVKKSKLAWPTEFNGADEYTNDLIL